MLELPLRALLLEDNPHDAELILRELKTSFNVDVTVVSDERSFLAAIDPTVDIVLADYNSGGFPASQALAALKTSAPDVPLIVISETLGESTAVALLNNGAADYLLKDRLSRLGQAIQRAIHERQLRRAKHEAENALILAEERIRFAIEASRVGIWEADLRTGTIRWSEMLESLHGLAPGTFGGTLGAFLERVDPADRAAVEGAIHRAANERTDGSVLYRTRRADGSVRWISASGRTFYDTAGRPLRAAGIAQDITKRIRLEEQYRQSQKMEAIGLLAGGIAHDFNNLLTAIEGYSTLMAEAMRPDDPLQAHLAEDTPGRRTRHRADPSAARVRPAADPRTSRARPARFGDLDGSHAAAPDWRERGHRGQGARRAGPRQGGPGPDRTGDPQSRDQRARRNATRRHADLRDLGRRLTNADARSGATVVPGRYTLLTVSDSGHGMDTETQARIFEPFFTTKQKGKGTGLGLSTVYGIVKQSGGYIWIDSTPGAGTRFSIYLPRVEEAVEPAPPRSASESLTGSETILVVEDEGAVRTLVQRVLERYGYKVFTAGTPLEAIELARGSGERIDLLISDVVLPQMSGRALADQILEAKAGTRLLFMSGYTDDAIVHHGVLDEGTPFIQKPFTPQALARKVRQVLA